MTGDGEGMQVANYSPNGKCWSCDEHDNLEPVEGVNEEVRRGANPPPWRVGDYAHARGAGGATTTCPDATPP